MNPYLLTSVVFLGKTLMHIVAVFNSNAKVLDVLKKAGGNVDVTKHERRG